jgi:hypothetical protein
LKLSAESVGGKSSYFRSFVYNVPGWKLGLSSVNAVGISVQTIPENSIAASSTSPREVAWEQVCIDIQSGESL